MRKSRFAIYVLAVALTASCGKTDKSQEAIDSLVAHMVSVEGGTFTMGATEEHKTVPTTRSLSTRLRLRTSPLGATR